MSALRRLSGGASRETWSFDLEASGTGRQTRGLILRRDPPGAPSDAMVKEAALLAVAADAGVPVPSVVAKGDAGSELGCPFVVTERLDGETIPRRILRDDAYAAARAGLAAQCGTVLARLHAAPPDSVSGLADSDQLAQYRQVLDGIGQPSAPFELAFRWLEQRRPERTRTAIVHGDFRHGNLLVGGDGLRAVLDWELAHLGDPIEDLGWLCVKSWRFGSPQPVGGFGSYDDLIAAYEAAGGGPVDRAALRWWEVLGNLKWGIMCMLQARTHTTGRVRSVELAAIGRRVPEVEWDLLALTAPPPPSESAEGWSRLGSESDPKRLQQLHGVPDMGGLVEAVREFLEGDVMGATEGRVQFHTRVAVNVLRMVERELELGGDQASRYRQGLEALGFDNEADLASAIRAGDVEGSIHDVAAFVTETVRARLQVANPRYLEP